MDSKKKKSRMFRSVNHTWNPVVGCSHHCFYCWARMLVKRRRYQTPCNECYNFKVHAHLERPIKTGKVILVCSMGDLFCKECPRDYIQQVLDKIRNYQNKTFIICSKNPARFSDFIKSVPDNCILGTTIETNRNVLVKKWSQAPAPSLRYRAMASIKSKRKFLSIEPIMEFDFSIMVQWIKDINPIIVEIGYNNYQRFRLPEPPLSKTKQLIKRIQKMGIILKEKTIREAWHERRL